MSIEQRETLDAILRAGLERVMPPFEVMESIRLDLGYGSYVRP